jgi:hypothetical protein
MMKKLAMSSLHVRHSLMAITSLASLAALPAGAQPAKSNLCGITPKAPVCNIPKCTPEGWKFWPIAYGSSCQIAGEQGQCDGGQLGPPGQIEPDAMGQCVIPAGSLNPQYYVLGVIYSPPGFTGNSSQASTVSYGNGSSFSHDTKVTSSFKEGVSVDASIEIPVLHETVLPLTPGGNYGYSTTTSTTNGLTVTKSATTTVSYPGNPVDGIDHDQDEIYLWLNPRVSFAESGNSTLWTLGINPDTPAGATMDVQFVKIGMLKGTLPMDTGVANELAFHNITKAQYPALIAMDPFANGDTPIDTNRFVLTGQSFPYEKGAPSTQLALMGSTAHLSMTVATTENIVGASLTAGNELTWGKLKITSTWTWTDSNSITDTNTTTENATVVVKGPSPSYAGSENIAVYFDTLYKTFMFQFINESPMLTGVVRDSKGIAMVHNPVDLTVGNAVFHTITDTKGEYRFFSLPKGAGTVRANDATQPVQIGASVPHVDFSLPTGAIPAK